jgi:hypothetical protein
MDVGATTLLRRSGSRITVPQPSSDHKKMRAQFGREVVHSYVVLIMKGGSPVKEHVGDEVETLVETGGLGLLSWEFPDSRKCSIIISVNDCVCRHPLSTGDDILSVLGLYNVRLHLQIFLYLEVAFCKNIVKQTSSMTSSLHLCKQILPYRNSKHLAIGCSFDLSTITKASRSARPYPRSRPSLTQDVRAWEFNRLENTMESRRDLEYSEITYHS